MGRILPCAVGRGGIGEKRAEGDGTTPVGVHRIERILVRKDRETGVGYPWYSHSLSVVTFSATGPADGWSDDPADPDYNRLVKRPHRFSHEALRRADPMYDIVAVLDWNRHPPVAGLGSAIFLHVWRKARHPTAGCVAFARADLEWVLARWTPRSRVVVRG
jgi:L,D-peptidoglycan transpeptidase YkuD (ErfK/YbiS/YcfS/YnhG family)